MKLNQVIALVQGRKARATKTLTDAYRCWSPENLKGLTKTYKPLDEDGDKLPSESKVVPLHADEVIKTVISRLNEYYDAVATQDIANQSARAAIVVGDTVVIPDVPVTVLLFFEKQLINLLTFTKSLPVLPMDKTWKWEQQRGCWITNEEETTRTAKLPKVIVKYAATKEHPAQTEMYNQDVIVGHWTTVHISGAIPKVEKDDMIERIEQLQEAVKKAREFANGIDIGKEMSKAGQTLVNYIFTSA